MDEWPGDGEDLVSLVRAVHYLRKDALWAGIHSLEAITRWNATAVKLLLKYLPRDLLENTVAEVWHNSFRRDADRVLLVLGGVLGGNAYEIQDYFTWAPRFITRVVGLRYGDREEQLRALIPGMSVVLMHENENEYDPNAIAVYSPWGAHLGYLRASLAAIVRARLASGEAFVGRVAEVMPSGLDPNERLYVEVVRVAPDGYGTADGTMRLKAGAFSRTNE